MNLLSAATFDTSAKAVGRSLSAAAEAVRVLDDALVFGVFGQLQARGAVLLGAREVSWSVALSLRQDELNEALAPRLRALAEAGQRLLTPEVVEDEDVSRRGDRAPGRTAPAIVSRQALDARGREEILAGLRAAVAEIEARLDEAGDEAELHGTLTLSGKSKG